MGDRVYMRVTTLPQYVSRFTEENDAPFMEDGGDEELGVVYLVDEEANYANNEFMCDMAADGVPFLYDHGDGCEYGAMVGACDGTTFAECDADHDGYAVTRCDPKTGLPLDHGMVAAKEYVETRERFYALAKAAK